MSVYDNSENIIEPEIKIKFWSDDPNILFKNMHEIFPTKDMTFERKLNALTRIVILLSLLGLILSDKVRITIIFLICILFIYLIHYYRKCEKENFTNPVDEIVDEYNINTNDIFDEPTSSNPFSNVLVSDYELNPEKRPAPPIDNEDVNKKILSESKKLVQELNPDQPDISEKLFKDLGEQYIFEQSLRPFHSNANTQVVNDQGAFAEFCYGGMVSCKEGNLFACTKNNYNLY
jgi:hypothetical protein